ncbi:MAG: biotin/lipoyl-containing protein, partial [Planctomycetota bacterium]
MPIEITMPRLSDTMEQGTVVKWNVKEGDTVSSGDVLADIETDKATMELESFDDGTIARLAAAEGEQVAVGAVIAIIAEEGEDASAAASSAGAVAPAAKTESGSDTAAPTATATEAAPSVPAPITAGSNGHSANGDRVFASPLARKIAGERGINLAEVTGSGPSGRIIKKDVENFTGSGVPSAAATSAPAGAASGSRASVAPPPGTPSPRCAPLPSSRW